MSRAQHAAGPGGRRRAPGSPETRDGVKAVLLTAPNTIEAADVPEPEADDGVVVALEQAGICGTDVKILTGHIPVP